MIKYCNLFIDSFQELPGFWAKIASDAELCVKGRHVMMGYLNNPEKTAEVLGEDGWLKSGDIASKVRYSNVVIMNRDVSIALAWILLIFFKTRVG